MGQVLRRDARTPIAHHHRSRPAMYRHRLSGWAPLAGIVQQVPDGPGEPVRVGLHPALLGFEFEGHQLGATVGRRHRDGVANQEVEAERLGRGGELIASSQFGHVADQIGQLLELDQHVVDQHGPVRLCELVDPADDLEVGAQAGERGAELM